MIKLADVRMTALPSPRLPACRVENLCFRSLASSGAMEALQDRARQHKEQRVLTARERPRLTLTQSKLHSARAVLCLKNIEHQTKETYQLRLKRRRDPRHPPKQLWAFRKKARAKEAARRPTGLCTALESSLVEPPSLP